MRQVTILDSTLRDGEQVPGATLDASEKLQIARQLDRLGVDIIEAGLPASSPGDLEAVKLIAREVRRPIITALARAVRSDIALVWEAVREAARPRIHIVLGTSDIHVQRKLRKSRAEILRMGVEAVEFARTLCDDVQYSTEDAPRSDFDYLCETIERVIDAGATVINVPDTVGYASPEHFHDLIRRLRASARGLDRVTLSVHCHNDLGMATAETLAAVRAGAQQLECCVNGIGERAGNAALEEVAVALRVRRDFYQVETNIVLGEIAPASQLVSALMGLPVQANKAVVGANAFAHSSGIHQDGILKDRSTYEIIPPEAVGFPAHRFVLTPRSGRHAVRHRLQELGHELEPERFEELHRRFLEVADKKKIVTDEDLLALVSDGLAPQDQPFELTSLQVTAGTAAMPTATVELRTGDRNVRAAACGDGPVDAIYKAIEQLIAQPLELMDYSLRSVTPGRDAIGEAVVRVRVGDALCMGRAVGTDILEASARAFVNALNRAGAAAAERPQAQQARR